MELGKYQIEYTLAAVRDFQLHQKNLSEIGASVQALPAKRVILLLYIRKYKLKKYLKKIKRKISIEQA